MKVLADRIRHLDRLLAQSKAAGSKD